MRLGLLAMLSLVILELAPGRSKRIAQRNIRIFVSMIVIVPPRDHDYLIGDGDFDSKFEQRSVAAVLMRFLDNDVAVHDVWAEFIEPAHELAYSLLQGWRRVHVAEGDL